jgi:hypothetical protein
MLVALMTHFLCAHDKLVGFTVAKLDKLSFNLLPSAQNWESIDFSRSLSRFLLQ